MYQPAHFRSDDPAIAAELMRAHPFATLVSNDGEGFPFATHLPLHLEQRGDGFVLLGHCARANPHARYLQARPQALATFLGPHAYLSPSVYPDRQRVPTWNYVAVHCRVQARIMEGPEAKDALLKQLIADHEPAYAEQWRSLPQAWAHGMLNGIVAFELDVLAWECKLKVNQHRPEALEGMRAAAAQGSADERALLQWLERVNAGPAAP